MVPFRRMSLRLSECRAVKMISRHQPKMPHLMKFLSRVLKGFFVFVFIVVYTSLKKDYNGFHDMQYARKWRVIYRGMAETDRILLF